MRSTPQRSSAAGSQPRQADWRQGWILVISGFLPVMAIIALAPTLPTLLGHFRDVPNAALMVPLLITAPSACIALFAPGAGVIADRFGRRPLLLWTAAGAAIGHVLTAWALAVHSYPLFLAARFGTGLLEGQGAIVRAMLADRLEAPLRNHALSWLNGCFTLGWLFGPLLAGLTIGFGITVPFYIAAGALLLGTVLVAITLRREPVVHGPGWWTVAREKHAFNLLRHDGPRTLFVVQLAYTCGVTGFYEFYPLWLVEVGRYDTRAISMVNVGMCALMSFTAVFAGRQNRDDPLRRAAFLALAVALAIASLGTGQLWIGLAGIMLFGLPHACYNAVIQVWAAERFGGHGQGAVMGLLSTTFCLANILMAALGAVLTLFDTRLVLVAGALLTAWAATRIRAWSRVPQPQ
jgi:predicted MFS family arabinose efflux permease